MPSLTLTNLDSRLYSRVRAYARRNRLTIPAALLELIRAGLAQTEES